MAESISLEETNRIRVAAGLQPIGAPPASGEAGDAEEVAVDEDQIAEQNYREIRDRDEKERKRQ